MIIAYLLVEVFYIMIANYFGILDKPNFRSSHQKSTARGGGIIFPLAAIFFLQYNIAANLIFGASLLFISIISFIDDVRSINIKIRLVIQSIAVIGLLIALNISLHWIYFPILFVVIIGIINAYNFMDGVNGITVLYSLVTISSLFWVNNNIQYLQSSLFFVSVLVGLIVFSFFNLRCRAICFAGDVGSVSMAFVICYLLFSLILKSGSIYWLFFLALYGIDTIFTIGCRICRNESLVEAHRSHFYQYLANERQWGHIKVAFLYAILQGILNVLIVYGFSKGSFFLVFLFLIVIVLIYVIFRFLYEGPKRLFIHY